MRNTDRGRRFCDRGLLALGLAFAFLAALIGGFPSGAVGQVVNARIQGTVTDSSGALLPGATVSVTNMDTNVVAFTGTTDSAGVYRALDVKPGRYSVRITADGFTKQVQNNVNASEAQNITLDFQMQAGGVDQTVTVESSTQPTLDESDATVATLITPSAVQDLPLNKRDITQTFLLVPGVSQGSNTNSQNNNQLSFNGSRTLGTNPLLDGTSTITASTGGIDTLPSPDALSEVKIITSNESAEYGRSSGATVLFTSASGTNVFHGGLYNLIRNEDFDANTWSNKNNNDPRSRDRFFQFGGTIGGPVLIPHVYNGKDRTFFFFNYDQTITPTSTPSTQTVPIAPFRGGDFSSSSQVILDPQTGKQVSCNGQLNVICSNRIDQAAAKYLSLLPGGNVANHSLNTTYNIPTNNYYQVSPVRQTNPKYFGRLDQTFNPNFNMFASVLKYQNNSPNAVIFNPILNQYSDGSFGDGWTTSLGGTYLPSATLIVQGHIGLYRDATTSAPTSLGEDVASTLGIAQSPVAQTPTVSINGGWAQLGPSTNTTVIQLNQTISYEGSATKILGPHSLKFGVQVRNNEFNRTSPTQYNNGQYVFDGSITNPNHAANNPINSLADFLLGQVKTSTYELPQPTQRRRNYNSAFFIQDDWKVNKELTVNLGLRQEFESAVTVVGNTYSRFDPNTGVLLVAGQNADDTLNTPTPKVNLGPHVGFAFEPRNGTVIRGGFSIVYGQIFSNLGSQVNSPGFDIVTNYSDRGPGVPQLFTFSQGMPLTAQYNLANPAAALGTGSPSKPISTGGPEFFSVNSLSSIQQVSFGVQQTLPLGMTGELNYIHSHGTHLPLLMAFNNPQVVSSDGSLNVALANQIAMTNTTAFTQGTQPFPNLAPISGTVNAGQSHYDALQISAKRQFNKSIAFTASYTLAHSLDDSSGIYSFSQPSGVNGQVPYNPVLRARYDYSSSEFDQRNAFNGGIQLTSGGNVWTRNFHLDAIVVLHSGLPQTITQSNEFPGVATQRPDGNARLARNPSGTRNGVAVQYYKSPTDSSFPFTPTGPFYATVGSSRVQLLSASLGDSGRSTQNQPGEETVNVSASRTFKVMENVSFQLRLDALNAFNHTNLEGATTSLSLTTSTVPSGQIPSPIFSAGSYGQITQAYLPRNLQLLTRIIF
jgi:hypothetical protein